MKSPLAIRSRALSFHAVLLIALLIFLAGSICARADDNINRALAGFEDTVSQVKLHMSSDALQAHESEIATTIGNLNNMATEISQKQSEFESDKQNVDSSYANVQSAQNDASQISQEKNNEMAPVKARGDKWMTDMQNFNATYAGKTLTMPEPYNTYMSEKTTLESERDDIEAHVVAINQKYDQPYQNALSTVTEKQQEYQNWVNARDGLSQSLPALIQQFQSTLNDITAKLQDWLKESPDPSPGNVLKIKSGDAMDALIRANSQITDMAKGNFENTKDRSGSEEVFDMPGGKSGTLDIVTPEGSVPAPLEMQKNQAVHDLANGISSAGQEVAEAQRNWDKIAHDPNSTAEDLKNADTQLTSATGKFMMDKYLEKAELVDCQKARRNFTIVVGKMPPAGTGISSSGGTDVGSGGSK